jgi:uncharacterized protein YjfI (DUF2170 family)
LRRFIAMRTDPQVFVNLPYDVFPAWVDTTVFVLSKRPEPTPWPRRAHCALALKTFPKRHKIELVSEFEHGAERANMSEWFAQGGDEYLTYANEQVGKIIAKIQRAGKPLGGISDVQRGVTPFNLTTTRQHKNSVRAFAGTVRRYCVLDGPRRFLRFDNSLAEPKPDRYFKGPRLLLRELISRQFRLQAARVTGDFVTNKSMQSILKVEDGPDLSFILGCLNSRLMSWYFLHRSNIAQRDDFPKIVLKETRGLPIPSINLSDVADKGGHDRMIALVERMLELDKKKRSGRLAPSEQDRVGREIAATDDEIDDLVYELYGVTDEERKTIEGG